MTRNHHVVFASFAAAALAAAAAGCGGTASGDSPSAANTALKSSSSSAAPMVDTAHTSVGTVVVDGAGRTLYLFAKDTGPTSTCAGACAADWPPFTARSMPATGGGVRASALALVKRSDGRRQVVLDGHPLYLYSGDQAAGQVNGQGLDAYGAQWFAVSPGGTSITASAPSSGAPTSRGGYGY